ncbi:MAG: family 16 glycoside hydrolase [Planctomycetales bacterium]
MTFLPGELAAQPAPKDGFVPLYNGKDLTGWEVKDGKIDAWTADGELLSCVGDGGGWLRTQKTYSDFVLKLEYRIPPGGNSGVGLRFPEQGNPAHDGMEIQILDDDAPEYKELEAAQYNGGVYYQAAAKRGFAKQPGEWNAYVITCLGPLLKVVLNGQTIVEVQLDEQTQAKGDYLALADRPELGFIGLQSHGSRVDFRNIQLKNLVTTTPSGLQFVDLKEGDGAVVPGGARVTVHYTGRLVSGKKFDSSRDRQQTITFPLTGVIKGWGEGLPGMKTGGRRKLIIPPDLAYGERGAGGVIPPDATLVFDVEVFEVD